MGKNCNHFLDIDTFWRVNTGQPDPFSYGSHSELFQFFRKRYAEEHGHEPDDPDNGTKLSSEQKEFKKVFGVGPVKSLLIDDARSGNGRVVAWLKVFDNRLHRKPLWPDAAYMDNLFSQHREDIAFRKAL